MFSKKICQFVSLAALVMLPLAGCSGGGSSPTKVTEKGIEVTVGGQVSGTTSTAKSTAKTAITANTVEVYDAQDGAKLGGATIASDGKFSGLAFTLPTTKTVLVFKATVTQGTFLSIVPIDLSGPPVAGTITGASPISIVISQESTAIAQLVSQMLGLSGDLGDAGQTLTSVNKTYAVAAQSVIDNGGQQLAYGGGTLALTGKLSSAALLPAMKASDLSYDDLINTKLGGSVTSAFIPGKRPIVNFTVTNKATGKGISGLTSFTLHVAQLKADGSTWLNYNLEKTAGSYDRLALPGTDSGSTVIDKGDGNYTVILGTDVTASNALVLSKRDAATANSAALTYDANLIHRIAISVTKGTPAAPINPATGATVNSFNPANVVALVYDFVPAAGTAYVNPNGGGFARDVVTMAACDSCHGQLVNHGHHFGSRPDTKVCVVCHTVQNKRTDEPSTEMTSLIHTLHMGHDLPVAVTDIGGVDASHLKYPQDQRNCTTCHKGVDANNFKTKASANGCLTCHNDVVPSAGTNHMATSVACATCHTAAGYPVDVSHRTPVKTANNPDVPVGIDTLSFEITDVSVNSSNQAVIQFKGTLNGSALVMNNTASGSTVLVDGYAAGLGVSGRSIGHYPTLYVGYSKPQDGINIPSDFNGNVNVHLGELLTGVKGTLTGPVSGVYTATITSATIPVGAGIVTGSIQGYGTLSKNGSNLVFQNVSKTATGSTARRAIVSNAKCNTCHEQLGSKPDFHGGLRNNAPACQFCHNPGLANNGWAVNSSTFVHGLHGASKRTVPYTWHKEIAADGTTVSWSGEAIGYPGILRNCEQCHVAGSYDFSITREVAISDTDSETKGDRYYDEAIMNSLLYTTVASGVIDGTSTPSKTASMSPYVKTGIDYGASGAATNLVNSPISAACFSCHDTAAAKSHMVSNGGSIYEARSTALARKESCLVCHGPRGADTTLPVTGAIPTIKTVHRWW